MHEYAITQSLLSLALEKAGEAGAGRINKIYLNIGELSGIVDECVRTCFDLLSRNTAAEGASLVFNRVPTQLRCRKCGNVFAPRGLDWQCPDCREPGVEIISGRECYMESIEVT